MMKKLIRIIEWVKNNKKQWFSGIGMAALLLFFVIYTGCKSNMADINVETKGTKILESNQLTEKHAGSNYTTDTDAELQVKDDIEVSTMGFSQKSITYEPGQDPESDQQTDKSFFENGEDTYYPISTERIDEQKAGDWVYYRYMLEETYNDYTVVYPVLLRYREGDSRAERVNPTACFHYEIVGDYVYYLDSVKSFQDHGELYVSRLDGTEERFLEEELHDFQIEDEYIYYTFRHDTVGVGLEGHALYRMNLDGSDKMVVAYEVSGIDMGISHFDYKVEDGWVDCGTFKMAIGTPADGFEEIVFKDIGDNEWIYYVTNRLIKARKDGSERVELDGVDDCYYEVEKIEDDWVYYIKGGKKYRIRIDGSGKEALAWK